MTLCTRSKRLLALLLLIRRKKKYTLKKTRLWVHSMNRTRSENGEFKKLCVELELYPDRYFNTFRMNKDQFDILYTLLKNSLSKNDTNFRKSIPAKERLVVTLR